MLKKEKEEKERYIKKHFPQFDTVKDFCNKTRGSYYKDIIEVDNIVYKGYHYSGLYDIKKNEPVQKNIPIYYYCKKCGTKKIIKGGFTSAFCRPNVNKNLICQKCKTKENTQKEDFKEKERIATKKAWEDGRFNNLKESGYFLDWGRKWCDNTLYKTKEEKEKIAAKKIKTYLSHSEEERKELDYRRTKHFIDNYKVLNKKNKFIKFDERFKNEWQKTREEIIRRDKFTCQKCGKVFPKSELSVHHIVPYRICKEDKKENLISLCKVCHTEVERFIDKMILEDSFLKEKELEFLKTEKIDKKELNNIIEKNGENIKDDVIFKKENHKEIGKIINETYDSYYIIWK